MQQISDTLDVAVMPVTPFQQNTSLLRCRATNRAVVIDPGGEVPRLREWIERAGVELDKVLLTHGHLDHAGGAAELARALGVRIEGPHPDDLFWLEGIPRQAQAYGVPAGEVPHPDLWLAGGDVERFGALELEVRHCPGHTPGHVVFFHRASRFAVVGDVLFQGSIGRTDFPRGDYDTLIRSITEELLPLGDDVTFLPGHGPTSTFGRERQANPFLVDPERMRGYA
jgi:glyoxylase-like metal-dependent hydrolase (beta-lactamase superfamily II)